MTVSSTQNRVQTAGNGVTTSFPTSPVIFFDTDELDVYITVTATGVSTLLTENTDYTVTGGAGLVGTVNLAGGATPYGAPATGTTVVVVRTLNVIQEANPVNNDDSDAEVIEQALDKGILISQQLAALTARSMKLADSDVSGASVTLPTPTALQLLGWDAAALSVINYDPSAIDAALVTAYTTLLLASVNAAAARSTLGLSDATAKGDILGAAVAGAFTRLAVGPDGQFLESNSGSSQGIRWGTPSKPCDGRLTLTTGVAVTTSDVTGASAATLYFTPYKGNQVALYNGSVWRTYAFTERSIAIPATTATMYDVFLYDNAGTLTLELLAWTNDTTRATALVLQDGVLCKTGALTRRYLGSVRTGTVSGQSEDSAAKRYLWNYYNRCRRGMVNTTETADSWSYTTATYRQANANAANQLDFVIGVSEDVVEAEAFGWVASGVAQASMSIGIGLDSTTVNSAQHVNGAQIAVANSRIGCNARYINSVAVGRHVLTWLEISSTTSGTTTWYGDNGVPTTQQSGIHGTLLS